jgi:hypothetical protein
MLEPLIMSKQTFDALSKSQQDVIMALGVEMEKFGTAEAMADDQKVADVYAKKGAKVFDLDEATVEKWARDRPRHRVEGLRAEDAAVRGAPQARRKYPAVLTFGETSRCPRPRPCRDRVGRGAGGERRRSRHCGRQRPRGEGIVGGADRGRLGAYLQRDRALFPENLHRLARRDVGVPN